LYNDLGLTQLLHPTSQSGVFACGSMVRSNHMFIVFALYERKNDKRGNGKYRSAEGLDR
jgi:hypothetical protein